MKLGDSLNNSLLQAKDIILDAVLPTNKGTRAALSGMGLPTFKAATPLKKPTVNKTLVLPDLEQTMIDSSTGMAQDYGFGATSGIGNNLSNFDLASLAMAGRRKPKSAPDSDLERALKERENFGYSLAKALSALPQQQGYGTWLTDFGRSFGTAYMSPTDSWIDREKTMAKEARENEKVFGASDNNDLLMYLLLGNQ